MDFEYPTEAREPLRSMPQTLLMQAFGKTGKSTLAAKFTTDFLPKESVVVSLGKEGGYDNHKVNEIKIDKMSMFEDLLENMIKEQPYKVVIFDHLSTFNDWTHLLGTIEYMSSPMGKKFNFKGSSNPPGFKKDMSQYYLPGSKDFKSVTTLPDGAGYYWTMKVGKRLYHKMKQVAKYIIFIGHIKLDRYTKDDNGRVTNSEFLDMTSGLARYICKDIDALCTLSRKKDEGFLSFRTGSSDLSAGCRYDYLENKTIKISEKKDGVITTFWEEIYPNEFI